MSINNGLVSFCTNITGGLARLWCSKCKDETIHRGAICIHCKTQHSAYPVQDLAGKWVAQGLTIKRRKWNGVKRK